MTEHLYIVGHPVSHSKSPVMYNALYEHMGLDWHYDLADCATRQQALELFAQRDFLSVNITMPYKPQAFEASDIKAASARLSGGVNMMVNRKDKLIGLNTDGLGCVRHMQRTGVSIENAHCVVCGTGPTSLAIAAQLALAGAADVVLLSRDSERAHDTVQAFLDRYKQLAYATIDIPAADGDSRSFRAAYEDVEYRYGCYDKSRSVVRQADIIVDATPLGMNEGDAAPFDTALLQKGQYVYDVVYGHGETQLAAAARKAGCTFYDGQGMLVAQAVENALLLLEMNDVANIMSWDDTFKLMADAAGFAC